MKPKNILFLIISLILFCRCSDFLDKPASEDITADDAYIDLLSARKVLNNIYYETTRGAYNPIARQTPMDLASDDAITGHTTWALAFNNGTISPDDNRNGTELDEGIPPTTSFWKFSYEKIRKANIFLERIDNVPGDETVRNLYKAEARFLRAFYHAELIRRFGGIVIVDKVAPNYQETLNNVRVTFQESVDWVIKELDEVAPYIPKEHSRNDFGRATKGAVYATKAKLLLTAASPLFNTDNPVLPDYTEIHYYGNYNKERWKAAADAAKQVMDLGYSLWKGERNAQGEYGTNYTEIFMDIFWRVSEETVWGLYPNERNQFLEGTNNRSCNGWNWVNPTMELAETFEMLNGLLPNESGSGYDFSQPGLNRDPRFKATIQYPGAQYQAYEFEPWIGGRASDLQAQKTGFCQQKLLNGTTYPNMPGEPWRWPIMQQYRYAEILLMYAEAMNEYNGPTSEVYNAINQIRNRVGMPDLPAGLTQAQMRERIQRERRVELAFEDHRFFDVRRWRIAEETQNGYLHGYDVTKGFYTGFFTKVTVGTPRVFAKKHYLYPIARYEILLNPQMLQNPGY